MCLLKTGGMWHSEPWVSSIPEAESLESEIRELWWNKILLLQFQGKWFSLFVLEVLQHPFQSLALLQFHLIFIRPSLSYLTMKEFLPVHHIRKWTLCQLSINCLSALCLSFIANSWKNRFGPYINMFLGQLVVSFVSSGCCRDTVKGLFFGSGTFWAGFCSVCCFYTIHPPPAAWQCLQEADFKHAQLFQLQALQHTISSVPSSCSVGSFSPTWLLTAQQSVAPRASSFPRPTLDDFTVEWLPSWTPPSRKISPTIWRVDFWPVLLVQNHMDFSVTQRSMATAPPTIRHLIPWDQFLGYLSFIYYSCIFQCSLYFTSQSLFTLILLELVILYIKLSLFKVLYSLCLPTWPCQIQASSCGCKQVLFKNRKKISEGYSAVHRMKGKDGG